MISGIVNESLEATIQVAVQGAAGSQLLVDSVIDTGFSEYLSLPASEIAALDLAWVGKEESMLADGSIVLADVYEATVIWDGQPRLVEIESAETMPLVGMSMLQGHRFTVEVVKGGTASIVAL